MNELMTRLKTLSIASVINSPQTGFSRKKTNKQAKLKTNTERINVTENVPDNRSRAVGMKFLMYYY